MDETPRTVGIADQGGMITGAYTVFGCNDLEEAHFLYLVYLAMDEQKRLRPFYTGLRKVITKSRFLSIQVAVPPKAELRQILAFVTEATAKIGTAIATARRQIELMREYRTRLIADVVTGKVDVRGVDVPEDEDESTDEQFEEGDESDGDHGVADESVCAGEADREEGDAQE